MHPPTMPSMFDLAMPHFNPTYPWSLINSTAPNVSRLSAMVPQNQFKPESQGSAFNRPTLYCPKPIRLVPEFIPPIPSYMPSNNSQTYLSIDESIQNTEPLNLCLKDLSNDMKHRNQLSIQQLPVCLAMMSQQFVKSTSRINKSRNRFSLSKINKSVVLRRSRKSFSNHATCAACLLPFPNMNSLNQHFLQRHQTSINHCLSIMPTPKNLFKAQLNQLLVDSKEDSAKKIDGLESNSTGGYDCPKCSYQAKWPTELQKHVMVHSSNRPFVCFVCSTSYKWSWDLGRHFSNSHPEIPNPYKKHSPAV